jgi:hypothetical protein
MFKKQKNPFIKVQKKQKRKYFNLNEDGFIIPLTIDHKNAIDNLYKNKISYVCQCTNPKNNRTCQSRKRSDKFIMCYACNNCKKTSVKKPEAYLCPDCNKCILGGINNLNTLIDKHKDEHFKKKKQKPNIDYATLNKSWKVVENPKSRNWFILNEPIYISTTKALSEKDIIKKELSISDYIDRVKHKHKLKMSDENVNKVCCKCLGIFEHYYNQDDEQWELLDCIYKTIYFHYSCTVNLFI